MVRAANFLFRAMARAVLLFVDEGGWMPEGAWLAGRVVVGVAGVAGVAEVVGPARVVGAVGGRADAVTVTVIVPGEPGGLGRLGFPSLDELEGRGGVRRVNVRLRVGADELEETGTDGTGAEGAGAEGAGVEGAGAEGAGAEGARVEGAGAEGAGLDGTGAFELGFGVSSGSLLKLLVSGAFVAELTTGLDDAEAVLLPTGSLKEDEGPAAEAEDGLSDTGAFDSTT